VLDTDDLKFPHPCPYLDTAYKKYILSIPAVVFKYNLEDLMVCVTNVGIPDFMPSGDFLQKIS